MDKCQIYLNFFHRSLARSNDNIDLSQHLLLIIIVVIAVIVIISVVISVVISIVIGIVNICKMCKNMALLT